MINSTLLVLCWHFCQIVGWLDDLFHFIVKFAVDKWSVPDRFDANKRETL